MSIKVLTVHTVASSSHHTGVSSVLLAVIQLESRLLTAFASESGWPFRVIEACASHRGSTVEDVSVTEQEEQEIADALESFGHQSAHPQNRVE